MRELKWLTVSVCLLVAGCAHQTSFSNIVMIDEDDGLGGTGLEAQDLRTAARKMASSLLGVRTLQPSVEGVLPKIALSEMRNNSRFIIDQNIFTRKIRIELNKNTKGRMQFLARERLDEILLERGRKRSGMVSSTKTTALLGVDYILTGDISAISKAGGGRISDYLLLGFQLIDAETSAIIWEDAYEIKKVGELGIIYQ